MNIYIARRALSGSLSLATAGGFVASALVVCAVAHSLLHERFATEQSLNAQLSLQVAQSSAKGQRLADAGGSFVEKLPARVDVAVLFLDLKKSAQEHGASIAALSAVPQPATPQKLGRVEVSTTLKGDYAASKAVLADVLERFPNAVLQRAQWRRLGAPTDLEATFDFSVLEAPLPSGAASGRAASPSP